MNQPSIRPGIISDGSLLPGLSPSTVRDTLQVLPLAGGTMADHASIGFHNGVLIQEGGDGLQFVCSADYPMRWEEGRLWFFETDGLTVRSVHEQFDTPGNLDDVTKGFVPGSRWHLTNGSVYECDTNSEGTAAWNEVTPVTSVQLLDYATVSYVDNTVVTYVGAYVESAIANIDLSSYATTAAVASAFVPRSTSVINRLQKTSTTTRTLVDTGITVDDSNNITGAAAISANGTVTAIEFRTPWDNTSRFYGKSQPDFGGYSLGMRLDDSVRRTTIEALAADVSDIYVNVGTVGTPINALRIDTSGDTHVLDLTASGTVASGDLVSIKAGKYFAGVGVDGITIRKLLEYTTADSTRVHGSDGLEFHINNTRRAYFAGQGTFNVGTSAAYGDSAQSITTSGSVSIGANVLAPALGLAVAGSMTVGGILQFTGYPTSLLPAASATEGAITYDTTIDKHVGSNGSTWNALW